LVTHLIIQEAVKKVAALPSLAVLAALALAGRRKLQKKLQKGAKGLDKI